jgi:hypothetical protein
MVAAVVVTLVAVAGVPAAHAGQNAGSMEGSGTMDPGVPCPASGCSVHAGFTLALAGQDVAGTASCTFDGYDSYPGGATALAGSGSGTISCSGGFSASGTVTYSRTGTLTTFTGNLTVNGIICVIVVFHGAWIWVSAPPFTVFVWIFPFVVIACV